MAFQAHSVTKKRPMRTLAATKTDRPDGFLCWKSATEVAGI
jgi:hypothetical protein